MGSQEMQAKMGEYIGLIGSEFWYNVELFNGVKSRVILTLEQELQGLGKMGLSILVKTRPEDNRDNNFLMDFVKLIES
jgi:hypothetical protein